MEQETSSRTTGTTGAAAVGQIPDRVYFRIGDVAEIVGVKPYVLRYWESEFPMISPEKSSTGQRVYRRGEVESLLLIKHLLYQERYSIEGARRRLRELRRDGELKTFKQEKVASALAASSEALTEEVRQNDAAGPSALASIADTIQNQSASGATVVDEYIEVRETGSELEVEFAPAARFTFEDDELIAETLASAVVEAAPTVATAAPVAAVVNPERLARMRQLVDELEALATVPAERFFPALS